VARAAGEPTWLRPVEPSLIIYPLLWKALPAWLNNGCKKRQAFFGKTSRDAALPPQQLNLFF
jgi:hypothetical protein